MRSVVVEQEDELGLGYQLTQGALVGFGVVAFAKATDGDANC
ncbi:MAG: hypothetical protein AAFU71_08125 [Cyanobacteria bacterium J06632_22]